jgi:hypothetical protein
LRWKDQNALMSSNSYSKTSIGAPLSGLLGFDKDADEFYFPYCTSDSWSGNATNVKNMPFSFLGGRLLRNIFSSGMINFTRSDSVFFSGSSAGAEGLYPHSDWLAEFLAANYGAQMKLVSVYDSGFFLDNKPFKQGDCKTLGTCTEQGGLIRGVPRWQSIVDASCGAQYSGAERWRCMLGVYAAPQLSSKFVLVQFSFDLAQLGHDGIYHEPSGTAQLQYAAINARNVTHQLQLVTNAHAIFSPACYIHTMIWSSNWLEIIVDGVDVWTAIVNGGRYLDHCTTPNCNPTCSKL